jgi:hypothetical protein
MNWADKWSSVVEHLPTRPWAPSPVSQRNKISHEIKKNKYPFVILNP